MANPLMRLHKSQRPRHDEHPYEPEKKLGPYERYLTIALVIGIALVIVAFVLYALDPSSPTNLFPADFGR